MKRIYLSSLLGFFSLFTFGIFTGCDNDITTSNDEGMMAAVTIGVSDFLWDTEQSGSKAKTFLPESINIETENTNITATLESSNELQTRATTLTSGVRYRIIAYKENMINAEGYVTHADYVVGNSPSALYLPPYDSYTLVCYSYGKITALPDFDKNATIVTAIPDTDDFMYCKNNITIKGSENYFSAVMAHLFSKVTVRVVSNNDFKITACSGTISPSYNATVSLVDGSLIKGSSATGSITWPSLNTSTITSSPITVNANAQTVTTTINSITFARIPVNHTLTYKSFTFNNKVLQGGKSYVLKIAFKISGITINGIKWAPGNLIYSNGVYSFASRQEHYSGRWDGGDYYCWNTLSPTATESVKSNEDYNKTLDPCQAVLPAGSWRMPSEDQLSGLMGAGSVWIKKNNVNGRYYGTKDSNKANAEPDSYVFLPAAGWRTNKGTTMNDCGSKGYYYSSLASFGLFGNLGYYIRVIESETNINSASIHYGYPIRCVAN